ncbi:tyrosine-type recombinase/integrase [Sinomonas atrocyanea]
MGPLEVSGSVAWCEVDERLATAWLASFGSDHTRRAYARVLRAYVGWLAEAGKRWQEAGRATLDTYRGSLVGSPATVAQALAAISSFYAYAVDAGALSTNPVERVKRPRVDGDETSTQGLTAEQAKTLLRAAHEDGARSYALVALLVGSGVRIGEALGADLSDYGHNGGHRVLYVTRKGGKRASVALPAIAVNALDTYIQTSSCIEGPAQPSAKRPVPAAESSGQSATQESQKPQQPVLVGSETPMPPTARRTREACRRRGGSVPLFTTSSGRRWNPSEAFRTVQRLARRAGIEGTISPHSLRHTFATLALESGHPLADLQDSMGHADPRTTRRYDRSRGSSRAPLATPWGASWTSRVASPTVALRAPFS